MTLNLQLNSSDNRTINKTISTIASLSGTMRQETSIINPVFTLEADLTTLAGCNYFTVDELGRSYYIKDIISLRNGLVQITGHIDVLYTYRNAILSQQAVIGRSENKYNLYMDDASWYINCKKRRKVINFPSAFVTNDNIIMTVIGGC